MQTFQLVTDANNYASGASRSAAVDEYNFTMYAPDSPGNYKVIVFSHGYLGDPAQEATLAAAWVAKGYAVLAPVHADSGSPLNPYNDILLFGSDEEARWHFRVDDAKIALDIAFANQTNPGGGLIPAGYSFNGATPIIAGHSFGASVAAIIAGAQPVYGGVAKDWADNRFEGAISLSGAGADTFKHAFVTASFDTIDIPWLKITGGHDHAADTPDPAERLDGVLRNLGDGDKHAVWIDQAEHSSLHDPDAARATGFDPNPAATFATVVAVTSYFLDAYVSGNGAALTALQAAQLQAGQYGDDSAQSVTLGGTNDIYLARSGNDSVAGGDGNDQLMGMAGADTLVGGNGADSLEGGDGADNMQGGAGDDFYIVDNAGDVVTEAANAGTDTVYAARTYTLGANVENLVLGATELFEGTTYHGTGNTLANRITGTALGNTLTGLDGNDTLDGAAGGDSLVGGNGADLILGGAANDEMKGDAGTDTLNGGEGRDTLTGGADNDVFQWTALTDAGTTILTRDHVTDFNVNGDLIDVSAIDAKAGTAGNQAFTYIGTAAFSAEGQIRIIDQGSSVMLEFNTTGNSGAEMQIIIDNVGTTSGFSAADFLL